MPGHVSQVRRKPRRLPEAKTPRLTDAALKRMIPMFVRAEAEREDHKCGNCMMRIPETQGCTIVEGRVDFADGTCAYWAHGKRGTTPDKTHEAQMSKETSGYAEYDGPINCGTCQVFEGGYCLLWEGKVNAADCCMAWDNPTAV